MGLDPALPRLFLSHLARAPHHLLNQRCSWAPVPLRVASTSLRKEGARWNRTSLFWSSGDCFYEAMDCIWRLGSATAKRSQRAGGHDEESEERR